MMLHRNIRPAITLVGTIALISPLYLKLERLPASNVVPPPSPSPRRLDLAIDDTDPLVSATLSVVSNESTAPISAEDHERISRILSEAKALMGKAKGMLEEEGEGASKEVLDKATEKFKEAKERIRKQRKMAGAQEAQGEAVDETANLRAGKSDSGARRIVEEEASPEEVDLDLDLARNVYETSITFPDCIEKKFQDCLNIVNADLANLGLSTVEMVVHEKRNPDQAGYNKVVIVTNDDATLVKGRIGDGIVTYPFTWDDAELGPHMLGVDGKWNCNGKTPEECCSDVKESAPNADKKGNHIECHIFVPFGGVGNAKRGDRVFINLSPDGRVHEAPIIQ